MRLTEAERLAILGAVKKLDPAAEVWVYGSRADDQSRGGDIDLLIVSATLLSISRKLDLLVDIKSSIGDQKIDLKIIHPDSKTIDPLAVTVLPGAIRL